MSSSSSDDPKDGAGAGAIDGAAGGDASTRDGYLWDPKAPAVDDVAALERALAPLASARNPALPPSIEGIVRSPSSSSRFTPRARVLAMVTSVAAAAAAFALLVTQPDPVVAVVGAERRELDEGERVDGGDGGAVLELGEHGIVNVAPRSVVRVVENARRRQELALERGALSAIVDAPPRFFTVGTPSARAVDMGCAYELAVDDAGVTLLTVTSGFVALEGVDDGLDVLVPAGASARAWPSRAPSLPFRSDATPELRAVLDAFAAAPGGSVDVDKLLAVADARDAITVWYALRRVPDDKERARMLERLLHMSPPPESVRVDAIRAGDVEAMHAWLDNIVDWLPR